LQLQNIYKYSTKTRANLLPAYDISNATEEIKVIVMMKK